MEVGPCSNTASFDGTTTLGIELSGFFSFKIKLFGLSISFCGGRRSCDQINESTWSSLAFGVSFVDISVAARPSTDRFTGFNGGSNSRDRIPARIPLFEKADGCGSTTPGLVLTSFGVEDILGTGKPLGMSLTFAGSAIAVVFGGNEAITVVVETAADPRVTGGVCWTVDSSDGVGCVDTFGACGRSFIDFATDEFFDRSCWAKLGIWDRNRLTTSPCGRSRMVVLKNFFDFVGLVNCLPPLASV